MSPLELSLAAAALLVGLTGAWSPCGFSMVETVGLAGDEGRRWTTIAACATFAPGAVLGGVVTFGLLAALGEATHGAGARLAYLIAAGADPNALDMSGVAALHRAVRDRGSAAVGALIDGGADPRLPNKRGSTPLHLAVQATGKSGAGTTASRAEQGRIIALLLRHGASQADVDGKGKSVAAAASSGWIRRLLDGPGRDLRDGAVPTPPSDEG